MIDCCVAKLEEMHDVADYFWWFQRFFMASPFILLVPDFDPTSSATGLLKTGLQKCGEMGVSKAITLVNNNKSLPDFVDAVKGLDSAKYYVLTQLAMGHHNQHLFKEKKMQGFWKNLAQTYTEAFTK